MDDQLRTRYRPRPASGSEWRPDQRNVLVRVVLRDLDRARSPTRRRTGFAIAIYAALHRGAVHHWASPEGGRRSLPW